MPTQPLHTQALAGGHGHHGRPGEAEEGCYGRPPLTASAVPGKQEAKPSTGVECERFSQGTAGTLVLSSRLAQEEVLETDGGAGVVTGNGMALGMALGVTGRCGAGHKTTRREVKEL